MWLLYVMYIPIGAFSNISSASICPPATSPAISRYRAYLKTVYNKSPILLHMKWPLSILSIFSREFISPAVVECQSCQDEYIGHILQGNVDRVLDRRREISIDQILEPLKSQDKPRLVLMEGAPGIGKSMLVWELCRKWEELSCMRQYSLIVLLRLRNIIVQRASEISQLFSCKGQYLKSLVEEVSMNQGNGVLFILDGFDELPKTLQKKGFLFDLMKGHVLPASTVLVTSRPSATAELLTSCRPKHIEIIGFTQESVKEYASSIFSSETLKKFMEYISASENPVINSLMYIPLNTAIIVQVWYNYKSGALLPHTLTELYTLLCLTILNGNLDICVEKLEDLPADLHEQFLHLSHVAFEGILNEKVIFHTLPPDLVHFGILDAVSEADRVSYTFFNLMLQEFLAAYHISHLGSSRLELFKQHGKDKRWNVVWRFVAGLTKFEHYESEMKSDLFIKSRNEHETEICIFSIHCLFEAQSIHHFSTIFESTATWINTSNCTPLETYIIDFCITTFDLLLMKKKQQDFFTSITGTCIVNKMYSYVYL